MPPETDQPKPDFGFTDTERLLERLSHERLMVFLQDPRTAIHHIEVSTQEAGEFLYLTLSQRVGEERLFLTFWGLGFDQQRQEWLTGEWRWYPTGQLLHMLPQAIAVEDAQAFLDERLAAISPDVTNDTRSSP